MPRAHKLQTACARNTKFGRRSCSIVEVTDDDDDNVECVVVVFGSLDTQFSTAVSLPLMGAPDDDDGALYILTAGDL